MKKSTFEITLLGGEKVLRHGYVQGVFGVHKSRHTNKWCVTLLKNGLSINMFNSKKLANVKALITTMNDRYNWDGANIHELAKLNGMSERDFYTELREINS